MADSKDIYDDADQDVGLDPDPEAFNRYARELRALAGIEDEDA